MTKNRTKDFIFLAGKWCVSLVLLFLLFKSFSWSNLSVTLKQARLDWFILAMLIGLLQFFVSALRWSFILRILGEKSPPLLVLTRHYIVAHLFNNLAPANLAGDMVRAGSLLQTGTTGIVAGSSVILERLFNLFVLLVLCIWALSSKSLPLSIQFQPIEMLRILVVSLLLGGMIYLGIIRFEKSKILLGNIIAIAKIAKKQPLGILIVLVLTVFLNLVMVTMNACNFAAVYIRIPPKIQLAIYALAGLLIALPVSIQGIGIREGIYVSLLTMNDIGKESVMAAMALNYAILILYSLVGGILFLCHSSGSK